MSSLTTEVTPLDDDRVRLDVAVSEEEVKRRTDAAVRDLGRNARIPGFRPGKAPANVIVKRLGREYVLQKMIEDSMHLWYDEALATAGVEPIDDPEVDFDGPPESGELRFSATVRTAPKPTLGTYSGLEVGRREVEVTDEAVQAELDRLRDQAARLQPVERAVATGDFATIDFEGTTDGKPVPNGSARDYLIEIGGAGLIPGFDENVVGLKPGESVTFPVEYPENDQREALAGTTVDYTVTVKKVQEKVLPELTDELTTQVSEFDTLEELTADIRSSLTATAEAEVEEHFRRAVVDLAAREATLEVPEVMVKRRVNEILHETAHRLPKGVTLEAYIQATGRTPKEVIDELSPDAEMSIKRELVVDAVAEAQGIAISDEDVEARIRSDAEESDRDADELIAEVRRQNAFEVIRKDMVREAAVSFLVDSAVPISMEQAEAREKLWTPAGKEPGTGTAKLWTPGDPDPDPTRKAPTT